MKYDKQNGKILRLNKKIEELSQDKARAERECDRLRSILDGILHETRRLNKEIGDFCDDLSLAVRASNFEGASNSAESVMYASGLISSRLTFSDFELNPESVSRQAKDRVGIYRKFDKARRLLGRAARRKDCEIVFEGSSFREIDVIPAFELVPFVLLDNAIKYSPRGQQISVAFEDRPSINCHTKVTVASIGPVVPGEEICRLTERGFRGRNAGSSPIVGEGLGLFLADTLGRLANARLIITSSSNPLFSVEGIPYSNFRVEIDFYKG